MHTRKYKFAVFGEKMIYALSILIVSLSALVGRLITKKYVDRDKFYNELVAFVNKLKNNINFRCLPIESIFSDYIKSSSYQKEFTILKNISLNHITYDNFQISYLKTEEKKLIYEFFVSLGDGNNIVELNQIESFLQDITKISNESKEIRKKNEGLIYKLSIAIGVVICILIV